MRRRSQWSTAANFAEQGEVGAAGGAAAAAKKAPSKKTGPTGEERGSALQKIAKLDIKGRIQLAMKGTKEDRSILIRDSTKLVALAVLESPKFTDGEVEKFAGQKNVLEAVLRGIPMKRRFAKNYAIVRALVFNPRTPLVGTGLEGKVATDSGAVVIAKRAGIVWAYMGPRESMPPFEAAFSSRTETTQP